MVKKGLFLLTFLLIFTLAACKEDVVQDPPVFSGVEDGTILQGSTFDPMDGVGAVDYDGNDLTDDIEVEGFVNPLILGEHVVTYSVTDDLDQTTTVNRFITVVYEVEEPHNLYNGDFSLDSGGWNLDTPGGTVDFEVVDEQLHADISDPGAQWWQIQVHQMVSIEEGVSYKLSVNAKSEDGKRIGIGLEDTGDGYAMLPGGNVAFELTSSFETYSFIYTSDRTIDTAKFVIYMGQIGEDEGAASVVVDYASIEIEEVASSSLTMTGVDDLTVIMYDSFDSLAGVAAFDGDTDITDQIDVVGMVVTNLPNNAPFALQYIVESNGERLIVNRIVSVALGKDDDRMLFNPEFDMGVTGWTVDFPVGQGTMAVEDGVVVANLTDLGDAWWHIQLSQGGISIVEGESYKITVVAKSDVPRRIGLGIENTANNFADLKPDGTVEWDLTTEYQTFEYIFNAQDTLDTAKYALFLGKIADSDVPSTVYVDTFKIDILEDSFPVLQGVADKRITVGTAFDPMEGVSATDTEDGDLTSSVVVTGTVDTATVGVYEIEYTVEDSYGNVANVTRSIEVVEATAGGMSVIDNPEMDGTTGWVFDLQAHQGTMSYVDGTVEAVLTDIGDAFWNVQLYQQNISVETGKSYLIQVRMKSDIARTIGLGVENPNDGYANLTGETIHFDVTEEFQTFYYLYTADQDLTNVKIALFMGKIFEDTPLSTVTVEFFKMNEADELNILDNSHFADDSAWVYDFPVGTGTMSVLEGTLVAELTDLGDAWWHIQLAQLDRDIYAETSYLVTFRASSTEVRKIGLGIEDAAAGYADLKGGEAVEWILSNEFVTYSYVFNSTSTIDTAKFALFFGWHQEGDLPSTIEVRDFMVIELVE